MQEIKDFLKNKKNLISLLTFAILALALPLGLNIIKTQKIFFSRASEVKIDFTGPNIISKPNGDKALKLNDQGQAVIGIELISPLGPPAIAPQSAVQNTQNNSVVQLAQSLVPKGGLVGTVYAQQVCNLAPDCTGAVCSANTDGTQCGISYGTRTCHYTNYSNCDPQTEECDCYQAFTQTCAYDHGTCVNPPPRNYCVDAGYQPCKGGDVVAGGCQQNGQTCTKYVVSVCNFTVNGVNQEYCGTQTSCAAPCTDGTTPAPASCTSGKSCTACSPPSGAQCGSGPNGTETGCTLTSGSAGCIPVGTQGSSCNFDMGASNCSAGQQCSNNHCITPTSPCTSGKVCTGACSAPSGAQCGSGSNGTETGCQLTLPAGCTPVSTGGSSCNFNLGNGSCIGTQTCSSNQCVNPAVANCTAFSISGLSAAGTPNSSGGPVYNIPAAGENHPVNVTFTPTAGATISTVSFGVTKNPTSAPDLNIPQVSSGGTIVRTANIPPNTGIASNTYDISATVAANGTTDQCVPVTVVVAPPSAAGAPSCTSFSPAGLTATSQPDSAGRTIYLAPDFSARNSLLQVTRAPSGSSITQPTVSPAGITFTQAIGGSGNWVAAIPENQSTTVDNLYTVEANATSGTQSTQCFSFVIKVPKKPADTACPASIQNTQVKFKGQTDTIWVTNKRITTADTVTVAGFHNQVTPDPPPTDTALLVEGPNGWTTNWTQNTGFTSPAGAGDYTFTATTIGLSGSSCTGHSTLHVGQPPPQTFGVRIAESRQALLDNPPDPSKVKVYPYTSEPFAVGSFTFSDPNPGLKTIFVEFDGSEGRSEIHQQSIELISTPQITSCKTDISGNLVSLEINGKGFRQERGGGGVKVNEGDVSPVRWTDSQVRVTLQNPPIGKIFHATVKNDGGLSTDEVNCSALSTLAVSAKLFCRLPQQHDQDNVSLILVGSVGVGTSAGTGDIGTGNIGIGTSAAAAVKLISTKVKILKDGTIQGLNVNLIEGQAYKLALKAPKSIRQVFNFVAGSGTSVLTDKSLPTGDIYPADGGDGRINSADRAELNRQWRLLNPGAIRTADFNQDGLVNSFDWSCMRQNFGTSDDPEPTAGP